MTGCEALVGLALFNCVAANPACLPVQHRHLDGILRGIAEQESGFNPNALRDETEGREVRGPGGRRLSRAEAEREAAARQARGATLGAGWFQITHAANWRRHGLNVANAFDPCTNMRAGASHFAEDYAAALNRYNSGRFDGAPRYATAVLGRVPRLSAATDTPAAPPASAARGAPECPGAPPSWDAFGTARHAAACSRRNTSSP